MATIDYLSVSEAARQICVSERTIIRYTEKGTLPSTRHPINNSRRIPVAAVAALKARIAAHVESADLTEAFRAAARLRGFDRDDVQEDTTADTKLKR